MAKDKLVLNFTQTRELCDAVMWHGQEQRMQLSKKPIDDPNRKYIEERKANMDKIEDFLEIANDWGIAGIEIRIIRSK